MIRVRIQAKEIHSNKKFEWVYKEIHGYSPEGERSFDAFKWGVVVVAIFNSNLTSKTYKKKRNLDDLIEEMKDE